MPRPFLMPLFTGVRRRGVLRSSRHAGVGGIMLLWWKGMTRVGKSGRKEAQGYACEGEYLRGSSSPH
jgi:hypothetical protein